MVRVDLLSHLTSPQKPFLTYHLMKINSTHLYSFLTDVIKNKTTKTGLDAVTYTSTEAEAETSRL